MNNIIVFNALQTSLSGGIGRYSYELAKSLYKNNPKNIKIVIRDCDENLFDFANKDDLIIVKNIRNGKERNLYEQFKLPKIIYKKYPNAIVHYPDSMAPIFSKNRVVITIHDLAFKSLNGVFTKKTVLWKNIITNLSIKKAEKIIAITNFTKNEIIKYFPEDSSKIKVIYNGFNDFSKNSIKESNLRKLVTNINKPYILTVSTISPRKNIDGIIKAFNEIKDEVDYDLVIAGSNGWMYESVFTLVKELNLSDRVIFTGKINDDELKFLYKNAKIFLYLSFYEGFGLPPLEAMSYGITSIVSNKTSIPEVVGKCAIKVNPNNINEISNKIKELIINKSLYIKKENMLEHINKFSWDKCSKETFDLYESMVNYEKNL
ncbi:glycosyltransferase family 1 protein [Clostridium perfringens]|nr:glycosyltransferase family 1 protein [Clostridium perfringens]